jgi:hypothetical protein
MPKTPIEEQATRPLNNAAQRDNPSIIVPLDAALKRGSSTMVEAGLCGASGS